ncbi:hypothetical protein BKM03_22240 [Pseudomonas avellanae]|uniref:Uncharacterized protein n=1 Tax=Pseudomonas avellanae TaxID=46257 RepID=A0AAD0GPQ9_9PSED|nr:hypothetical protein BKM03_22240 [Pseudomonas avellanae]MBL3873824.1 hypothetical protein [Pseudomonas syringae pv. theae]NAS96859.1 hypothetical protein [Pseudomonas syringae pv. actinidifoliorum]POP86484.1 hypothetical protein CXB34_12415 [Pseudomonas amygdali pv. morsprunorum]NAT25082.1 hypothetical protein [Pseudomonas syringae pv. actinidifoliorum]
MSAFFRLFLRFFAAQRHGLFEGVAHFVEAFVVQIVNAPGALCAQVDQFFIVAHGLPLSDTGKQCQ